MKSKQTMAFLLSALMASTTYSVPTYGFTERELANKFCAHHKSHDTQCGYTEAQPSVDCNHEHTEDCYTEVTRCVYAQNGEIQQDTEIPHVCTVESGCIIKELNCNHVHDENCNYQEGTAGSPCTFVCDICDTADTVDAVQENAELNDAEIQQDTELNVYKTEEAEADVLTPEFLSKVRSSSSISVATPSQFTEALNNANVQEINVIKSITLGDKADSTNRMLPIEIPANKKISAASKDVVLTFRAPLQLKGDNVVFENIKMQFTSSDTLNSVAHREIFLAGHSLTLNNVDTYLAGAGGSLGQLGSSEKELLPTVYAGGYPSTNLGRNASLTVTDTSTQFKGIYMGDKKADGYEGDYTAYTGTATLNLNPKTVVKEGIFTAGNTANITLQDSNFSKSYYIEGDEKTTLTIGDNVSYSGVVKGVGTIALSGGSNFQPSQGTTLKNVNVPQNAKLNLSDLGNATIAGEFQGGGTLVLDRNGSLKILGNISGTTTLLGQTFENGKSYITAENTPAAHNSFELEKSQTSYTLNWDDTKKAWVISQVYSPDEMLGPAITRVEVSPAMQTVNINDIHYDEHGTVPTAAPFEIKWYEQKDGKEQIIPSSVVNDDIFSLYSHIYVVKTDSLKDDTDIDWLNVINFEPSKDHENIYYLCGNASDSNTMEQTKEGEYTIFFVSNYEDEFDSSGTDFGTIAQLKTYLKYDNWISRKDATPIKAETKVKLYKPAEKPGTSQADITGKLSVPSISPQKYTGAPIQPQITEVTYQDNKLTEFTDYVVKYEKNIEVGQAKAIIIGQGKYKGQQVIEFEIAKGDADTNLSTDKDSYTYGEDIAFTFQATPRKTPTVQSKRSRRADPNTVDFYYQDTLLATVSVDNKNQAVFTYKTTNKKIPAGQPVEIRAEFGGSRTLEPANATKTITINKQEMKINSIRLDDITYDGKTKTLPIAYATLTGNAENTVRVSGTATVDAVDAGSYTKATIADCKLIGDDTNWYTLEKPTNEIDVSPAAQILKANAPAPVEKNIFLSTSTTTEQTENIQTLIDSSAPSAITGYTLGNCDLNGVIAQTPTLDRSGVLKFTPTGKTGTAKIPVTVQFKNHVDMLVTVSVTVSGKQKADLNLTANTVPYSKTSYSSWSVGSTVNKGDLDISYLDIAEGTTSAEPPTKAGQYMITAKLKDSSDKVGQESVSFEIKPKEVAIKVKDRTIAKGSTLPDLSSPTLNTDYEYETGKAPIGDDNIGKLLLGYQTVKDANTSGTYTDEIVGMLSGISNSNYHVTVTPGTLTINDGTLPEKPTAAKVTITEKKVDLKKGAIKTLNVKVEPEGATAELEWSSDKHDVATVENGMVKAVGTGTAIITVKVKGTDIKDTCTVNVADDGSVTPSVNKITLTEKNVDLKKGAAKTLNVKVEPESATAELEWSSDKHDVATVENGTVKAVGTGTAIITVKVKGTDIQDTCTVNVTTTSSGGGSSSHGHGSSGGGGSSSSNKTDTTTKSDGTKVETTTKPDGTKVETTTKPDGTVITTQKNEQGDTMKETENPDGSSVTDIKNADGTTATIIVDKNGQTKAEVNLSDKAIDEAKKENKPVSLPVSPVEAAKDSENAPVVKVETENAEKVDVTIPVKNPTDSIVAVIVRPNGTEEVIRKSMADKDGITLSIENGTSIKIIDNTKTFTDTQSHWAENAIDFVTSHELYSGTSAHTFSPNTPMTRGMLAVVLHNLENNPAVPQKTAFKDVKADTWYTDAVQWASEKNIVSGYKNGKFGPNDNITREQLAVILYRYAGSPAHDQKALHFTDAEQVSAYAKEAMQWAVDTNIISGVGKNKLNPKANATRAEVAAMLMRLMNTTM